MPAITPPELQGLLAIAREEGLDMKPVLLRVVTDLYIATTTHSVDEELQFSEIAGTLIEQVDPDTALVIACKLAQYHQTPPLVGAALLARRDDSTRIVLADASWVSDMVLEATALDDDRILAAAVASRPEISADLARILIGREDPLIDVSLAANSAAHFPADVMDVLLARGRDEDAIARALLARNDLTGADRAIFYLTADRVTRRLIIDDAERLAALSGKSRQLRIAPEDVSVPLETAAMCGDDQAFRALMSLALGVSPAKVDRLLSDRSGEALALALVSLGISDEVATRIFMFRDPLIGHSTERVFALTELSRRVSPAAAERIITAILGESSLRGPRRGQHLPGSAPEAPARPGASAPAWLTPHEQDRRAVG